MDTLKVGIIGSRLLSLYFGLNAFFTATYLPEWILSLLDTVRPSARLRCLVILIGFIVRLVVEALAATHLMMNSESVARWAARFVDQDESAALTGGASPIPHPDGTSE